MSNSPYFVSILNFPVAISRVGVAYTVTTDFQDRFLLSGLYF